MDRSVLVYGKEKSRFIKNQDPSGLLSKREIKTRLIKTTLTRDILF